MTTEKKIASGDGDQYIVRATSSNLAMSHVRGIRHLSVLSFVGDHWEATAATMARGSGDGMMVSTKIETEGA